MVIRKKSSLKIYSGINKMYEDHKSDHLYPSTPISNSTSSRTSNSISLSLSNSSSSLKLDFNNIYNSN